LHRDGWDNGAGIEANRSLLEVDQSFTDDKVVATFLEGDTNERNALLKQMKAAATACRQQTISEDDLIDAAFVNITG